MLERTCTHAVTVVATAAHAACGGVPLEIIPGPTPAHAHEVIIYQFTFKPQMLRVARGTTVTWVNRDTAPHTATRRAFDDGQFDSGFMGLEDRYSRAFPAAGTFDYLCIYHPGMQGTVVVE